MYDFPIWDQGDESEEAYGAITFSYILCYLLYPINTLFSFLYFCLVWSVLFCFGYMPGVKILNLVSLFGCTTRNFVISCFLNNFSSKIWSHLLKMTLHKSVLLVLSRVFSFEFFINSQWFQFNFCKMVSYFICLSDDIAIIFLLNLLWSYSYILLKNL